MEVYKKQGKKRDFALAENKQEGPGQVVMYIRATSVPPGHHNGGGKPALTEERRVTLLCSVLPCTADGETEGRAERKGGSSKGWKGATHPLPKKHGSITKFPPFSIK